MTSRPVLHFYHIPSKYSEGYLSYRADTKSISNTKQREINPKASEPELSFLYLTHLVLLYISIMYHKIFQRVFNLQKHQKINAYSLSNTGITKGDNTKSKKCRVVNFLHDMSSCPVLHFYQIPSKYPEGCRHKIKFTNKTKGESFNSRKLELSFLYMTSHLILFYISTKYYKNIPKSI